MIKKIINWIAYKSDYGRRCRVALWKADAAARKLEQGYRERYVQPRSEFDELIQIREDLQSLKNEGR